MLIQTKPNKWSCMATAFAMVLDLPVAEFFRELGHDGSQVIHPELSDPAGRRGVHVQECLYVALNHGRSVTPVELVPQILTCKQRLISVAYHNSLEGNWRRFETLIRTTQGVVTGRARAYSHAMAYDRGHVYDPDTGGAFPYSRDQCEQQGFYTQCLWIVT